MRREKMCARFKEGVGSCGLALESSKWNFEDLSSPRKVHLSCEDTFHGINYNFPSLHPKRNQTLISKDGSP
jgi:hypothetical protein